MCHAWIAHWTVARATLTMSRRRSTRDERTHGWNEREPLLMRTRARLAPRAPVFESWHARRACESKNGAWRAIYISNQALPTHTSNITYENRVLNSLNKIPSTTRVV